MDGFLKRVGWEKQRNDFSVHLAGRGRVQVAVKAVGVFEFVRGIHGEQAQTKAEKEDDGPEREGERPFAFAHALGP
jgi:hypothetical protein